MPKAADVFRAKDEEHVKKRELIRGDISEVFVCLLLVFKVAALRGAFVCAVLHRGQ